VSEHVVQHERQALGRCEAIEHDEHRQPHRVGQQRLLLGVRWPVRGDDGVRSVGVERVLPAVPARAQRVQALPRDDGGQPAAEVVDALDAGPAQPQPGVLDRVVGLGRRAEHPVRRRPEPRSMLLEALGEPLGLVHPSPPSRRESRTPRMNLDTPRS